MFLRKQMKGWYLAIVAPLIAKFHRVICSWEIHCFFPLFFLLYSVLVQYVGLISFFLDGTIVSFYFFLFMHGCSLFGCCINKRNQIIEYSQVFMIGDLSEGRAWLKLNIELHFFFLNSF